LHAAPRHRKPSRSRVRLAVPALAVATVAGAVVAFVILQSGSAAPRLAHDAAQSPVAWSAVSSYRMDTALHRDVAVMESQMAQRTRRAARRRHLAALAAARHARAAAPSPSPSPSASPTSAPRSGGGDAANSSLGICVRDAEEGGSYAWGPGNGGGAYQFLLSTWERYGGAASEYGVAGPAYQNQIFDNAIAAGGASNWTDYDGC
jgi:hypothetical protein